MSRRHASIRTSPPSAGARSSVSDQRAQAAASVPRPERAAARTAAAVVAEESILRSTSPYEKTPKKVPETRYNAFTMFFPLIYWVVLPIFMAYLLVRWIKKTAPLAPAADVRELFDRSPIEKKWFRAARRDGEGLAALGDFEKQMEAVDAAYAGKERAQAAGKKAEFLVFNDKAELLEQVDS